MKKVFLFAGLTFSIIKIYSQEIYTKDYSQLKEFEGLYEYKNNERLKIAASPKDTSLYAVIGDSRYKLTMIGKDLFLTKSKEKVFFFRSLSDKIAGYISGVDSFRLLSTSVFFPKTIWYPRLPTTQGFNYNYLEPQNYKDGLETGKIQQSGLDTALLSLMMRKIIDGAYPNVHSILIIKDGKLVFEEYFYEYNKDSLQELRSASKSFVSALVGIAVEKKAIKSVNERVLPYFSSYDLKNKSTGKNLITIENLLTNQSGLDCDVSNPKSEGNETVMNNTDDWIKFTLDLPMVDTPGGKGMYCSGNPITLAGIIEKTTNHSLSDFAAINLFSPLGITKFKWNFKPDKSSSETFCQLYLRPRDMAKFGLLYLNKGNWKDKQIIAKNWVEQSLRKHSVVQGVDYGYLWWIKYLDAGGVRYYGKAAQGNGGQKIYIWEKQNMVTVVTGGNYNSPSSSDELISKYILPAFNNK